MLALSLYLYLLYASVNVLRIKFVGHICSFVRGIYCCNVLIVINTSAIFPIRNTIWLLISFFSYLSSTTFSWSSSPFLSTATPSSSIWSITWVLWHERYILVRYAIMEIIFADFLLDMLLDQQLLNTLIFAANNPSSFLLLPTNSEEIGLWLYLPIVHKERLPCHKLSLPWN